MAKTQTQIDDERKENEYHDLMQLSQYSPLIEIYALNVGGGHPPSQYEIIYTCRGYVQPGVVRDRFVVRMTLPAGYPRVLPDFRCADPPTIYHPHIIGNWVCIGHQYGMPVGLPLREYVIGVGEMIQWRKDTEGQGGPVDDRALVGREPEPERPEQPITSQIPTPKPPRSEEDLIIMVEHSQDAVIEVEPSQPESEIQSASGREKQTESSPEGAKIEVLNEKRESAEEGIVIEVLDEKGSESGQGPIIIELPDE